MNKLEVYLPVFSRVSLRTVEALRCVDRQLEQAVTEMLQCQHWWYLRACCLSGATLQSRPTYNWTNIYFNLRLALSLANPLTSGTVMSVQVIEVLIELGYDPAGNDLLLLTNACLGNSQDRVKFLLEDERVRAALTLSHYHQVARLVQNESVELVRKQLGISNLITCF